MRFSNFDDVTEFGQDVLREIGSIGTGNAATAISSILNANVEILLPGVKILNFNDAVTALGEPEEPIMGVISHMTGEIEGIMLFLVRLGFINGMTKSMINQEYETYFDLDELAQSVVTEVGNILISSYINSLSGLTGMEVNLSVPSSSINMLGGILNVPMAQVGYETDKLMLIDGKFLLDNKNHESSLLLIPTIESLEVLIRKLVGDCG